MLTAIEAMNRRTSAEVIPLPIPTTGDYTLPDWDWTKLIWGKIEKRVANLQRRIYRAIKEGQFKLGLSLERLLNRSACAILLGVRRVTQENKGRHATGVDKFKADTPEKRKRMALRLMDEARRGWEGYIAMPAKRKYILKPNGKLRPLGVPTQFDRVAEYVAKSAMEPHFEALFESCSYGFRPAMGTHDAIAAIFKAMCRKPKTILDADITGCFDNIDHEALLNLIPKLYKDIVKAWLERGYIYEDKLFQTTKGTPQGGIISPLLANIVLDGMERDLIAAMTLLYGKTVANKITVVRFADDFVIIHEDREVIETTQKWIQQWLATRGLSLSAEKTKIVTSFEGFDFLGWNVKLYANDHIKGNYKKGLQSKYKKDKNGGLKSEEELRTDIRKLEKTHVLRITPSTKNIQKHKDDIKKVFSQMKAASQEDLILRLNPIISGWANYHRYIDSSQAFSEVQDYLWHKLYKWAVRRHPNKSWTWIQKRYWTSTKKSNWTFSCKSSRSDRIVTLRTYFESKAPIGSYIKVQKGRSFYDGDTAYWAMRLRKGYGNITPSKAKLLRSQDGRCPVCGNLFNHEDLIESHHIIYKRDDGKDAYKNLILIHLHCHDQLHAVNK